MPFLTSIVSPRQTGIRQRSLKRHCRLGRATELAFVLATGVMLVIGGQARAETAFWLGYGTDWTDPDNWSTGLVPTSTAIAVIDAGFNDPTILTNVNVQRVNVDGGTLTVAGTLSAPTFVAEAGTLTITSNGQIYNNVQTSGTFSNRGSLYGALTISSGSVVNAGYVAGDVVLEGGLLRLEAGSDISDFSFLTIEGGVMQVAGSDTIGALTLSEAGTVELISVLTTGRNGASTVVAGMISGTGGLAKIGSGTMVLSGNNTYSGVTSIGGGTVRITSANALGSTAAGTLVTANATLEIAGDITTAERLMLNGSPTSTVKSLINLSGTNTLTERVTLGSAASIEVQSGTLNLSGGITGTNKDLGLYLDGDMTLGPITTGTGALAKTGNGTLTLTGTNTNTGEIYIGAGKLLATGGAAIADTAPVRLGRDGIFEITSNETIGSLSGDPGSIVAVNANRLTVAAGNGQTFGGGLTGTGEFDLLGSGSLTLSGISSFTGTIGPGIRGASSATLIIASGGRIAAKTLGAAPGATLELNGNGLTDAGAGLIVAGTVRINGSEQVGAVTVGTGGTLEINNAGTDLYVQGTASPFIGNGETAISGTVTGAGRLSLRGGKAAVLGTGNVQTAITSAPGVTLENRGTVGRVLNYGTFTNTGTAGALENTFEGGGSSSGTLASLTHNGSGTFTNTGVVTGNTSVRGGTLTLDAGSNLSDAGTLSVTDGVVNVNSAETVGLLDASGGTVNLAATLTAGALSGDYGRIVTTVTGGLIVGASNLSTSYFGEITGDGTLTKTGTGALLLGNYSTEFTGAITVADGTLLVNGEVGASVNVNAGATLGGAGYIGGTVTLADGGILAAGNSPGQLTFGGDLVMDAGALLNFELGLPGLIGPPESDLITVNGNLTLDGTLNLIGGSAGYYRLFDYYGTLTDNGLSTSDGTILTNVAGQVNLRIGAGPGTQYWDGVGLGGDGNVAGGPGTWDAASANWTTEDGLFNDQWLGGDAVFGGVVGGNVLISGTQMVDDLDFTATGYALSGGTLMLSGTDGDSEIDVVSGTATIGATLAGTAAVEKLGAGTLVLTAANSFTGATTVSAGTLALTGAGALASTSISVSDATLRTDGGAFASGAALTMTNGTLVQTGAETLTELSQTGGTVSGAGITTVANYTQAGGGTLALGATINATTGATLNGGTIAGTLGGAGPVTVQTGTTTVSGTIAGDTVSTGRLDVTGGSFLGSVISSNEMNVDSGNFTGGLTNAGYLVARGAMTGNVTNDSTFVVAVALTGGGATFDNTWTLAVNASSFTGLGALANEGSVFVTGGTLGATTITNTASIALENGTLQGAVVNTGTIAVTGASILSGGLSGAGRVDLASTTGESTLTFTGAAGSIGAHRFALNYDGTGTGDRLIASGGQIGGAQVFDITLSGDFTLGTEAVLVEGQTGIVNSFSVNGTMLGGAVTYAVADSGGNTVLVANANPGLGGIASGVSLTQSLITNVVNRPSPPFADGLAAERGCKQGGFARGVMGRSGVTGAGGSRISASYGGLQAAWDVGCNDGRFLDGWDGAIGAMIGQNTGRSDQPILLDLGAGAPTLTSTTQAEFRQTYAGVYVLGSRDGLTLDGQLRYDRTRFTLDERVQAGFAGLGLDGETTDFATNGLNVTGRASWRMDLNDEGLSLEPTAGLSITRTDDARLRFTNGNVLDLEAHTATLGFVGATLARSTVGGGTGQTVFASATYYKDLGRNPGASFTPAGGTPTSIAAPAIDGFGEASLGWTYSRLLDQGPGGARQLNLNLRADTRFGGEMTDSYSLTAQVRLSF